MLYITPTAGGLACVSMFGRVCQWSVLLQWAAEHAVHSLAVRELDCGFGDGINSILSVSDVRQTSAKVV